MIGGRKRPYSIKPADDGLWMLAGLSDTWQGPEGSLESFTIITTTANAAMVVGYKNALRDKLPGAVA